ncbi:MAG: 5-oxoprolinase subunit PxpA [Muricauda sp.]|nr:5-oxoprolinase subunit PxpA [Allomuricauda sp.]
MKEFTIDINCDVGEGVGNEAAIFPYISSCNIACGGHAGDLESMKEIVQLAILHNTRIGAHPSYPDKANFGREVMDIPDHALIQSIKNQLSAFYEVLDELGGTLHHIKPHGALYNQIAKDEWLAEVFLKAVEEYRTTTILYAPFNSIIAQKASDQGWKLWYEAFADRNYNPDLSLVSRKDEKALIRQPKEVLNHVLPIIKEAKVKSVSGEFHKIKADTLCVHGDTASALEILMYLSKELPNHQVQIQQ